LRINGLRWARLCVVSTSTSLLTSAAWASHTHKLQPGDTLAALARRYHVTVGDIARANHISETTVLTLGRTLLIPNAPRPVVAAAAFRKPAKIGGDRVSVRIGPGERHRRLTMFDVGAPVVVTAYRDGWAQVALPDGRVGWVRQDLLAIGGKRLHGAQRLASSTPPPAKRKPVPQETPAEVVSADRRRARRHLTRHIAKASAHASKKRRQHQPEARLARTPHSHRLKKHHVEVAATRRRRSKQERWVRHSRRTHQRWARHPRYVPEASLPAATTDVVRTAYSYRGTPYRWGGSSRSGFDCSGFTSYLYRRKGVNLPHSASAQFRMGHRVGHGELKPGDLVFFETVHKGISHVGMYVGNGRFVHASSRRSGGVRVDSLQSGYYRERFRGARRMTK